MQLKLFAWKPKGHGQLSFFVVAENEADALRFVQAHIDLGHGIQPRWNDHAISEYDTMGWGTDYYELTVAEVGEVLTNYNS